MCTIKVLKAKFEGERAKHRVSLLDESHSSNRKLAAFEGVNLQSGSGDTQDWAFLH